MKKRISNYFIKQVQIIIDYEHRKEFITNANQIDSKAIT
jgi:hypothetical protein